MPASYTWTVIPSPAPEVAEAQAAAEAAALPRDIALDLTTGELDLSTGGLRLTRGAEAVAQSLYIRLRFAKEEWFLDLDAGLPLFESILVKAPNPDVIRNAYRDRILGTVGVSAISSLETDFDEVARELAVSFSVATDYGELAATLEEAL